MVTHATPGIAHLRLRLASGAIDVRTVAGQETTVEVEVGGSGEAARELRASVREELRTRSDGDHDLIVEVPKRRWGLGLGHDLDVRIRVTAPDGSHLDAETASAGVEVTGKLGELATRTASGDVTASGRVQSLNAKSASGDVRTEHVGGEAKVRTTSGSVALGSVEGPAAVATVSGDASIGTVAGPLEVTVVSGDLEVGEAGAGVNVRTVSGDVRIDAVISGEVTLGSVSGDLSVGVRRGRRVWLDLTSRSGSTDSDLDAPDDEPSGGAAAADVTLRANSVSGDIRIHRERDAALGA
jgi:hypothetical protein